MSEHFEFKTLSEIRIGTNETEISQAQEPEAFRSLRRWMLRALSLVVPCVFATLAFSQTATLVAYGTTDIFHSSACYSFPAAPGQSVTFSSVTGLAGFGGPVGGIYSTTGDGADPSLAQTTGVNLPPQGVFSGLQNIPGLVFFLTGVFVGPSSSVPPTINFSGNTNFTQLSPLVNQLFFIGDGLTGTGTGQEQVFHVPAAATGLCLGFGDGAFFSGAPTFSDNWGSLTATFTISGCTTSSTASGPCGPWGLLVQDDVVNSSVTFANPPASYQDTFSLGPESLGLFFELRNPPANLTYRLKYLRPDFTMAFDTGTVNTGIPGPPSDWSFFNWNTLNLNVQGMWSIELDLNGKLAASSPFTVGLGTGTSACGATDVSHNVGLDQGGFLPIPPLFNLYSRSITLINQSSQPISAPIYLVFDGLPQVNTFACPLPAACSVTAAVAITHCQSPSPSGGSVVLVSTSDLAPGQSITVRPQFLPAQIPVPSSPYVMFNYTLRLFSGEPQ